MSTLRQQLSGWACAVLVLATPCVAAAQTSGRTPADATRQGSAPVAQADGNPFTQGFESEQFYPSRPVLRVGQDYVVPEGTTAREVVVITGSATINGRVERDVVVILGTLRVGPAAEINGSVLAVAGAVTVAPGARVRRDFVVVGGGVDVPPDFYPGREHMVIGASGVADRVQSVLPWATRGLLLGRLIVPSLSWMWMVVAIIFFVYMVLNLLFERPVRACADVLAAKPLSTFLVGLLVLLLTGPVAFILAVSIVGLVVLPFAVCALLIAWVLGKVGVSRAIGASLLPEDEPGNKLQGTRSFAIGFAIICVAYMIPVLGLLTFVLVAVFGLGCATMALMAGLRRENPAKPKPPRPIRPVVTATVPPVVAPPYAEPSGQPLAFADAGVVASPYVTSAHEQPSPEAAGPSIPPPVAPVAGTLIAMPKAMLLERAAAFVLDVILVLFTYQLVLDGFFRSGPQSFFLFLLAYHVVFWTMKSTTVGGIICNLRLVRTDGGAVGLSEAMIRGLSSILSIITLGIGCLWIAFDAERQAWHDRIAGTYVVKVPRNWPL